MKKCRRRRHRLHPTSKTQAPVVIVALVRSGVSLHVRLTLTCVYPGAAEGSVGDLCDRCVCLVGVLWQPLNNFNQSLVRSHLDSTWTARFVGEATSAAIERGLLSLVDCELNDTLRISVGLHTLRAWRVVHASCWRRIVEMSTFGHALHRQV